MQDQYAGMEKGDAQVGGCSCAEVHRKCRSTGQETDFPSEVSIKSRGVDRGDGNNISTKISDRA